MAATAVVTRFRESEIDIPGFTLGLKAQEGDSWKARATVNGGNDGVYALIEAFGHNGEFPASLDGQAVTFQVTDPVTSITTTREFTFQSLTAFNTPFLTIEKGKEKRVYVEVTENLVTTTFIFQKLEPVS